ncbi:alpha/beta hydrolase [Sulfurifustis variabilis]|uniref:Alpha/beta hydrolase n=1 Tax=Sulfurifustis variabilis TaxID=1675686 RepID=A0A1B4V5H4_9GAMM|nr:alpha/beta fold hydrolase [Sulfurifustis variabilis]BAU48779.1 alpha/beta hydrolase [Sulfurifustis variabilis]
MRRLRQCLLLLPALLALGCTPMFFQPLGSHVRTPADINLAYEDVHFSASDGVKLHGWFLPARGKARATVLFLHGNAENISTHIGSVYWLPQEGFNVFLPDYRGYGRSQGVPTLEGLHADVDGSVRYLLDRPDLDPDRLIVFGQSLGGAIAVHYVAHTAHRRHIRGLVVDSAFASYRDIVREKLASFWLTWPLAWPLARTVEDAYSPVRSIAQVSPIPLLIIHGERDPIVPPGHARRLYEAADSPKALWLVPEAGHIQTFGSLGQRRRFVAFLEAILPASR